MLNFKKLLSVGLLSAFALGTLSSYGAPDEGAAIQPALVRLIVSESDIVAVQPSAAAVQPSAAPTPISSVTHPTDDAPQAGCWGKFLSCWKKTSEGVNAILPILRNDLLPILQIVALNLDPNSSEAKQLHQIASGIEKGTTIAGMIFDPSTGQLTLPSGVTIANALWYLWNEKSSTLTDDSVALGGVMINRWMKDINGDTKKYGIITAKLVQLTLLLSKADDPKTPYNPVFNPTTGTVSLKSDHSPQLLVSIPLFGEETTPETHTFLKGCFAEFVPAYERRTSEEISNEGRRIPGSFLPATGVILSAYNTLRGENPLYRAIDLAITAAATVTDA